MRQDYHKLLKPEIINSISGLSLISRVIVDGYLAGSNRSRRIGQGMEFSQYRGYEQGDDLRLLDWKMLARSGKYFIKQSEIDTNITLKFILDSSHSMSHSENGLSKLEYVKVLVASLAYLAQNQGDAIGLYALNQHNLISVHPRLERQHFNRLLLSLVDITTEGKWPKGAINLDKFQDRSHRELLVFVTDLHEYDRELNNFIQSLKNNRNEIIVLHILGNDELNFNYDGSITFEDLETNEKVKVESDTVRSSYASTLTDSISKTKNELLSKNIAHYLFVMGEPLENALNLFLKMRSKLL